MRPSNNGGNQPEQGPQTNNKLTISIQKSNLATFYNLIPITNTKQVLLWLCFWSSPGVEGAPSSFFLHITLCSIKARLELVPYERHLRVTYHQKMIESRDRHFAAEVRERET